MKLKERQAIAFVHRDQRHTHVHVYVNRIGFDGKAYNDSFIGKQSQFAAERVAKQMGLTTVREVQQEKLNEIKNVRQQIKDIHEKVMDQHRPRDFDQYIERMKQKEVKVIPSINKAGKLQGFRFEYNGHNLKGSEVHRSMSGGRLAMGISNNAEKGFLLKQGTAVKLLGKATDLSANIALKLTKQVYQTDHQKIDRIRNRILKQDHYGKTGRDYGTVDRRTGRVQKSDCGITGNFKGTEKLGSGTGYLHHQTGNIGP